MGASNQMLHTNEDYMTAKMAGFIVGYHDGISVICGFPERREISLANHTPEEVAHYLPLFSNIKLGLEQLICQ